MTTLVLAALAMTLVALLFLIIPLWYPASANRRALHRWTAVPLILVPLGVLGLYRAVGNPAGLQLSVSQPAVGAAQVDAMVQRLAQRLAQQPDDVAGWEMLARSCFTLARYAEASAAYARLSQLRPDNAAYLTSQALSLALSRQRNLQGEPEQLLARALQLDPHDVRALSLSGSAAFDRRDYAAAIAFWNRVLAQAPPDSEVAVATRASIGEAERASLSTTSPIK